ncbi:MAG TPA: D-alanyl-D-alanine carboxypeptidase/D-alanyl-D-alanine-endopeptidase [Planctomycetota bacterium]|nr:D-alanyl-D-alanine carboxypeptidase/D-alanyl-D-alanine-endopeptidase [Planctomycetota bacterium]
MSTRLEAALRPVPNGGVAGVMIYDVTRSEVVYERDAHRLMSIASLTKALVAAAALWELGSEVAFRTRLVALGPIVDGTVAGLGVIGGGSPCLDEHFSQRDPDRFFTEWAAAARARGVQRVDGDLVIDARLFSGPIRPATYPQDADNLSRWYSAPASAFAWNDNCISVRVVPTRPGEACRIETRPRSPRISVRNLTKTVGKKADNGIRVTRAADDNALTVSGTYSKTTAWFDLAIHADPDLLAGDHLKAVLADAGIAVSGTVRLGTVTPVGEDLVDLRQPLVPALAILNQRSQNFYGEQLLRLLGARREHEGSIAAGSRALATILAENVPGAVDGAAIIDGSGLSYGNRATAAFVIATLAAMHGSPHRRVFYESLKLEDDVKPPARVKTGTLAIASCLAGYIDRPDGNRWAFAILLNKGDAGAFGWASGVRVATLKAIAAP